MFVQFNPCNNCYDYKEKICSFFLISILRFKINSTIVPTESIAVKVKVRKPNRFAEKAFMLLIILSLQNKYFKLYATNIKPASQAVLVIPFEILGL